MKEDKIKAYINIIMAVVIWGSIGVFRRNIPMSSAALAFVRAALGTIVLLLPALFVKNKDEEKLSKKVIFSLFACGVLVGVNWVFLFESYKYTTVATATLCYYMEPTMLIGLSPIFFKEKLGVRKLLCALAALAGMVLISGILEINGGGQKSFKGVLLGLGAAVLYTFVVIINKKFPVKSAMKKTRLQLIFATLVIGIYLLITGDNSFLEFTPASLILTLIVGVVHTGIAYVLFYGSVEKLPAASVAIISYIDPVLALILSAVVLREGISLAGILGAILIISSAIISEIPIKRAV